MRCKVCSKQINASEDHVSFYHAGRYHIVCCAACAVKFEASPERYMVET